MPAGCREEGALAREVPFCSPPAPLGAGAALTTVIATVKCAYTQSPHSSDRNGRGQRPHTSVRNPTATSPMESTAMWSKHLPS